MKKAGRLTAFVLALTLLLSCYGCGEFLKSVNSLEIDSSGSVKAFSISDFDKEYYSGTELRKQILDSVSDYNKGSSEKKVSLSSCKIVKKKARVLLKYQSIEDYAAFNNVLAWMGTITEAVDNGLLEKSTSAMSADGTLKTTVGELLAEYGEDTASRKSNILKVLVIEEPLMIKVPGKVKYVIGDVKMNGGYAVTGNDIDTVLLDEACYIIYK